VLSFPAATSFSVTKGLSSNFAQTAVLATCIADIGISFDSRPSTFGKTASIVLFFFGSTLLNILKAPFSKPHIRKYYLRKLTL